MHCRLISYSHIYSALKWAEWQLVSAEVIQMRPEFSPLHQCDSDKNTLTAECRTTMACPCFRTKSSLTARGLSRRLAWQTVCRDQGEFGWATAATQRSEQRGMQRDQLKRKNLKAGCLGFVYCHTLSSPAVYSAILFSTSLPCPSVTGPVSVCSSTIQASPICP